LVLEKIIAVTYDFNFSEQQHKMVVMGRNWGGRQLEGVVSGSHCA